MIPPSIKNNKMEKIVVEVHWAEKNFNCGWAMPGIGTVIVAEKSLDKAKQAFKEALDFHIEGMLEDGDTVPGWLANGDYEITFKPDISAILREAEQYTTMTALSKASGINLKQLSHYANSIKTPREPQRAKIISGIHKIGQELMAIH